jgi:glutaredoxin-like protein NrdH
VSATLYSKPACVQCTATVRWLKKNGHELVTVDLTQDPAALELVKALGYEQAPVIVIDDTTHWSGFQPGKLAQHFPKEQAA